MYSEATDEELMLELKIGDKAAFNELFNRYEGALYRYLLRRCGNRSNAEELFQEVWEKLYISRDNFLPQSVFRAYFYRIAHNHVIDYYRKHGNREKITENDTGYLLDGIAAEDGGEPHRHAEALESKQVLLQEISRLPPEQREVFLLKEESGLSLNEVADLIGVSYETAKSRLRYAVNKLHKRLKEYEY